jgi:chorismate synthase
MRGSEANDQLYVEDGNIKTYTNNNGGILGGITNGMPLIFRVAFKPTSSIGIPQKTVDISKMENTILEVKGRHDPCIVQRAVPVIEAVTAMALLDLLYDNKS